MSWWPAGAIIARIGALVTAFVATFASAQLLAAGRADASTVCGTTTVAYAMSGECGTYDGVTGWFGTYGPGFPTAGGWALDAALAGSGAPPDPTLAYSSGSAPPGSDASAVPALGFALSEAGAAGAWQGGTQFSADDIAVAAQLLYDQVVWGEAAPATSGGVLAAYDELASWDADAAGATGSPILDMNTTGIGPVPTAGAIFQLRLVFPGSGVAASGFPVSLSLQGGTFEGGATATTVTTDALGAASVEVYADSSTGPVTVGASAQVGSLGMQFYDTSDGGAIAGVEQPTLASNSDTISASATPSGTGTVSVDEGGDDVAYIGLAGGVYQVLGAGGAVVATLTTDASGAAGPSAPLPVGTYTVHEATPPPGYAAGPDQTVTVVAGGNATAHFTGADENLAIVASLNVESIDAQTNLVLSGARFEISYSPISNSAFTQQLGSCITNSTGSCTSPGNDGGALLPGLYEVTQVEAAPGYFLPSPDPTQVISLAPGQAADAIFRNEYLASISVSLSGNDTSYYPVSTATFDVRGPLPLAGLAGTMSVGATGTSDVLSGLLPGSYTLTETSPPPGYQSVPPFTASVALGHAVTNVQVSDSVDPATLDVYNLGAGTSAPIVGGVFDVRYDVTASGVYGDDLGTCTTDAIGACSPASSAGLGLLPGRYEVTEVAAPPGYAPDQVATTRDVVLEPGSAAVVDFSDPQLVAVSFTKRPTGNYDPGSLDLAGAEFQVRAGSGAGAVVATCTTSVAGTCTTAAALVPGDQYCWAEATSPPGFEGGEHGCLDAGAGAGSSPVVVDEPGEFVQVEAVKVASGAPGVDLAGAVLDLYRMDGGTGPLAPTPPAGAPRLAGGTWVAAATTGATGPVEFPLELPGYGYCVVEQAPPEGFLADASPRCTGVLAGSAAVPAVPAVVTVADEPVPASRPAAGPPPSPAAPSSSPPPAPAPTAPRPAPAYVTIRAHKYDSLDPTSPIGGAVYDLYVVGGPLPGPPPVPPTSPPVATLVGDHFVERGRTDAAGDLDFVVPAGHAWCLLEVSAPPDFVADPRARCTGVLDASSPPALERVELPERPRMVDIQAHKFNSLRPDTGIPGAVYAVFSVGGPAPGARRWTGAGTPARIAGGAFYELGVTGPSGEMVLEVPAGHEWCLKEVHAPPGYRFDPALHCTAVLTARRAVAPVALALPELPTHLPPPPAPPPTTPPATVPPPGGPTLPFTGFDVEPLLGAAAVAAVAGAALVGLGRRREASCVRGAPAEEELEPEREGRQRPRSRSWSRSEDHGGNRATRPGRATDRLAGPATARHRASGGRGRPGRATSGPRGTTPGRTAFDTASRATGGGAVPAVTVEDILVLPRVERPDPRSSRERPVRSVTAAPSGLEGEGFPVRRAFAGVPQDELDPFVHMDQMGEVDYAPGEPKGTPWHPHRGFETVTYLIDGTFRHQDSIGGGGLISDGDTQWMTAGAGILHIEAPPEELVVSGGLFHGIQLWVNLPAASKWEPPRYQDIGRERQTLVASHDAGALIRVIAGSVGGNGGPGATHTPITLVHATVEPGARVELPWPREQNALVYVLAGSGTVGSSGQPVSTGRLAVLGAGDHLVVTASPTQDSRAPKLEVLLLGGVPIREPVAWYGPFVMNTEEEIRQAFDDYQKGRLGTIPAVRLGS